MDAYPLVWRVALAQLVGCLLLCVGVLYGPVDSFPRALVVGACAGCAASALAGFRFPGWPWFSAGLACSLAGMLRQHWGMDLWPAHLLWSCAAILGYVLVWPLAQAFLIQVFQVEPQVYEDPLHLFIGGVKMPALLRGSLTLFFSCANTAVLLLLLGTSAFWFASPAWFALAFWLTQAYPGSRPEWQLVGVAFGFGLLLTLAQGGLDTLVAPALAKSDSFWLLGQALVWTTMGYWANLWYQRHLLAQVDTLG